MKTSLSILIFFFVFALNTSCQEEMNQPVQTLDDVRKMIIGEWIWEKTTQLNKGQEPMVQTPDDDGNTVVYSFNEEGKMTILVNETITQDTVYEIELSSASPNPSVPEFKLGIAEPTGMLNLVLDKNMLTLSDGLGTSRIFVKK